MADNNQKIQLPLDRLKHLRQKVLHRYPELSGDEKQTAEHILSFLKPYSPDEIVTGLGGHGVAAIYRGQAEGPRTIIRCELDALAIDESLDIDHQSKHEGISHKCGHDGHMAIVSGLATMLHEQPPKSGEVVLLYQPSEEDGQGAKAVIADKKFKDLEPDWVFALHNLPGFPLNQVIVKDGRFNPAVNSLIVRFRGCTSHAAEPEKGRNPALAMAELVQEMTAWNDYADDAEEFTVITPVYQHMGEKAYGVSAGDGEVHFTMRCDTSGKMKDLEKRAEQLARKIADKHELALLVEWLEEFYSSHNDEDAVDHIRKAAEALKYDLYEQPVPFKWGEDFGMFVHHFRGAMFCIGAGEDQPALHHPDYDFPDEIIETGTRIFYQIIARIHDV